jgi:hypothetical protein
VALDAGVGEINSFEGQRVLMRADQRLGEVIAEVERGGMAIFPYLGP